MRHDGFSLAELCVGLVVGAIVVLMLAAMGTIAAKAYRDLRALALVDSDRQFVVDTIRTGVRGAMTTPGVQSGGTQLTLDTAHRLYYQPSSSGLFYENTAVVPARTLRVLSGISALVFTVSGDRLVTVGLAYTQAGVTRTASVVATRRNAP